MFSPSPEIRLSVQSAGSILETQVKDQDGRILQNVHDLRWTYSPLDNNEPRSVLGIVLGPPKVKNDYKFHLDVTSDGTGQGSVIFDEFGRHLVGVVSVSWESTIGTQGGSVLSIVLTGVALILGQPLIH